MNDRVKKLTITGILVFLFFPTTVNSQMTDQPPKVPNMFTSKTNAIMLGGLSIEMTMEQMETTISRRGYECIVAPITQQAAFMDVTIGELSVGENSRFCYKKENMTDYLRISNDKIFYQCNYFGVCDQGLKEVAQSLVDQGKIDQLVYDLDRKGQVIIGRYCGTGVEGDRLCAVDETHEGRSTIYFELSKGAFGNGGRIFD